jgi:hypothetical protein
MRFLKRRKNIFRFKNGTKKSIEDEEYRKNIMRKNSFLLGFNRLVHRKIKI